MRVPTASRVMVSSVVVSLVLAILGLALVIGSLGLAQEPAANPLPEGLRHVPLDAMGFIHIRAGEFLRGEMGKQLLQEVRNDKDASRGLQKIQKELGLDVTELESVTLLVLGGQVGGFPGQRWNVMPRKRIYAEPAPIFKDKMMPPPFGKDEKVFDKEIFKDKKIDEPKEKVRNEKDGREELFVGLQHEQLPPDLDPRELAEDMMDNLAMSGPLVIVTSAAPLDRKAILKSQLFSVMAADPFSEPQRAQTSIMFLSDRSILIGAPWELVRYSGQMARKPGPKTTPMRSALALAAEQHVVSGGGHLPAEVRRALPLIMGSGPEGRALALLAPLFQTEAAMSLDIGKSIDLTVQFQTATVASADQSHQAVKSLRTLAELVLERGNEAGESTGWQLVLEKRLKETIASAVVEQKDTLVRAKLRLELDPILIKRYTKEVVSSIRHRGDRTRSINNLKQIGLAMHGYHDANKALPPAGLDSIRDGNGTPLLSWRVAILPYIEQAPLYQQFDLTLPWDHPHNKKLIPQMPNIYLLPGAENSKAGLTHYRVLVGPGTMFEKRPGFGRQTGWRLLEITDGTSNTIMAVEAHDPTIWTRPDDLPYDPKGALPKLGTTPDGFLALFGDATVRFIRSSTREEDIRAMITRNGGEVVNLPDDR